MEEGKERSRGKGTERSFSSGAIALVFLVIGYQLAVFVHKAATMKLAADRDRPDTVYVYRDAPPADNQPQKASPPKTVRKEFPRSEAVKKARDKAAPRAVETFRFNPNTVSVEDLCRLGFTPRQAQAIDNYRAKGGRFRRPADFARSYVVSDSVFSRLEAYIDIPKVDINKADSAALVELPGIGPYYASKIIGYREALGGAFSYPEQLMEIKNFDTEKFDALKDLITCRSPEPYPLWTLPEEQLSRHPYISRQEAHGIVLFRTHHGADECTVEALKKNGVLSEEHAAKLSRIVVSPAQ